MVKYKFEFSDKDDATYTGEFSNGNYTGQEITIDGFCSIDYDLSENIYQPIRVTSCNITLRATLDEPLEDIWNEDDKYWLFTLYKGTRAIFQGYASTEDMEQPYNSSNWELNFDAFCHLHYLQDIGYFDGSGLQYTGTDSLFSIIRKCLDKGFNTNDPKIGLITAHHLEYNSTDLFENVYLDQEQFYDEDGEALDCFTVLENILKSIGAFIVQYRLNYVVMSVSNFVDLLTKSIPYKDYDSDGNLVFESSFAPDSLGQRIGDEINNTDSYHINTNQSFRTRKFYNAFKIRHNFEYADQILPNGELIGAGATMPNWTVAAGETTVVGDTLEIEGKQLVTEIELGAESSAIALKQNDVIEVVIVAEYQDDPTEQTYEILLENTGSGTDYSYTSYEPTEGGEMVINEWRALPVGSQVRREIEFSPTENEFTHTIQLPALPEDGDLTFKAYTGIFGNNYNASTSKTILKSVTIKALEQPLEAEEWIVERTDKTTGQVPDVYELPFNTVKRTIIKNVFLDSSGLPIEFFNDGGLSAPMARHLSREFIRFFGSNGFLWSGDVFNNIEFTPKRIDTIGSNFVVTRESKDLGKNISALELEQVN